MKGHFLSSYINLINSITLITFALSKFQNGDNKYNSVKCLKYYLCSCSSFLRTECSYICIYKHFTIHRCVLLASSCDKFMLTL